MWRTRPNLLPVDLQAIKTPTLVIVGEADDVMASNARQMAEALPHGSLEILPGGHFTPLTYPGLVNGRIAAFLDIQLPQGRDENEITRKIHAIAKGMYQQHKSIILETPEVFGIKSVADGQWRSMRIKKVFWPSLCVGFGFDMAIGIETLSFDTDGDLVNAHSVFSCNYHGIISG